ncbi:MAG: response regulator, partial [Lachnospiraceae bacterium]|nr:response regulator [Lachnospiraceae bacterium]
EDAYEKELMQQKLLRRYEQLFVSAAEDIYSHLLRVDLETWETIQIDVRQGKFTRIDVGNWEDYLEARVTEVRPEYRERVRNTFSCSAFEQANTGDKLICSYESEPSDNTEVIKYYTVTARVQGEKGQRFATVFSIDHTELVENERKQKTLLESALAQAQQANLAKTTFLSNMSHDMRTPMNAIIGFSAIAASHIDNTERVKDCLDKIMSSSKHLLNLINDILDMSRIESGKVQIQEQECNLSELLHTLANIIQPQVKEKQLDFFIDTVDVANEDIYADPLKLNQIFINILGNAVKFTPAGGSVSFRMCQKACAVQGYATYEFSIKDTGIGMSDEFMEHIFEPFERESSTLKSGIEGTGLGMAITKKLVEIMGGTISVSSVKGKGTEFVIILDLKLQEGSDAGQNIKELEGLRALVVDDDADTCESVTDMLSQIGMRSEWTTSAGEAILRAREAYDAHDPFHTYILDLNMPGQEGIDTVGKIREAAGDEIPVIIATAYDWSDVEKEAKEAGITEFCSKPLFMSDLRRALLKANHLMEESTTEMNYIDQDFSGKRVLLVEDNELNREIATEILREAGFTVEEAVDGSEAV